MRFGLNISALVFAVEAFEINQNLGSTNNTDTGAADGIWTGHDWKNTQFGVKDGVPYGLAEELTRKISSP